MNPKVIHLKNLIRYSFLIKSLGSEESPDYIIEKFNVFFRKAKPKPCYNICEGVTLEWKKKWKISDDSFEKNKNIFYFTRILCKVNLTTSDFVEVYNDFFYFPDIVIEGRTLHHLLEKEIIKWIENKYILRDYKLNSLITK